MAAGAGCFAAPRPECVPWIGHPKAVACCCTRTNPLAQATVDCAGLLLLQGLDLKRELHREQLASYDVEKQKFSTIKELNGAPIVRQLNGGRGHPYPNLRMS